MSNLPQYVLRATDANGAPVAGAKLYTYRAGGVIPEATYADEAYSTANANPVVADGSGYFGPIYLNDFSYHLVLKDSTGVVLFDRDDVRAAYLTNSELRDRVLQIASSPLDFGAAGDGATDDSSALQLAIDTSTGTVDLLGKTYRCDSALILKSGLTLRNGTLDFTNSADTECLSATGSNAGLSKSLTVNATHHDTTINLANTNGLSSGDLVRIYDGGWGGELCLVSVVNALDIVVQTELYADYSVAQNAAILQLSTIDDLKFENVTVIGNVAGTSSGLFLDRCRSVALSNCEFRSCLVGVNAVDSLNIKIRLCRFYDGKAIKTGKATQDVSVDGCTFYGSSVLLGDSTLLPGFSRAIRLHGCKFDAAHIELDYRSQSVTVDSCSLRGGSATYNIYGVGDDYTITNNQICSKNGAVIAGIHIEPGSGTDIPGIRGEYVISGNTITGGIGKCIYLKLINRNVSDVVIENNLLSPDAGTHGVHLDCGGIAHLHLHHIKGLRISNNTIRECSTAAIAAASADHFSQFDDAEISDNVICRAAGSSPVSLYPCESALVSGNTFDTSAVSILDCIAQYMQVENNQNLQIRSAAAGVLLPWRPIDCVVSGNTVTGATAAISLSCITPATSKAVVSNNVVTGTDKGIYVAGSTYATINGNDVTAADEGIDAAPTSGGTVTITGNRVASGADAVVIAGANLATVNGNVITSTGGKCIKTTGDGAGSGALAIVSENISKSPADDSQVNIAFYSTQYGMVTSNIVVSGSTGILMDGGTCTTVHAQMNRIVSCTAATSGTTDTSNFVV